MSVKTITEGDQSLTIQTLQKVDHLGAHYWQARAMFRIADGRARADVITSVRHASVAHAERAVVELARRNGWGLR